MALSNQTITYRKEKEIAWEIAPDAMSPRCSCEIWVECGFIEAYFYR
jgi:hypothetical protein